MQDPLGGYVLIPFAGSGSECVAAKKLGLPFVAIEINPDYVELIMKRLDAVSEAVEDKEDKEENP
jgi:site-specific DNA-methyltransferase (adenine-specific)